MPTFNQSSFNSAVFNQFQDRNSGESGRGNSRSKLRRSYLVQELLNYFDDYDTRVRRGKSTLDVQFLNPFGLRLEDTRRRLDRETDAYHISRVPLNIDNGGVWWKALIPHTYEFRQDSNGELATPTVRASADGRWKLLNQFDDSYPIPAAVATGTETVPCRRLIVHEFTGPSDGYEVELGELEFPNFLYLRATKLPDSEANIQVSITGWTSPRVISLSGQPEESEVLTIREEIPVKSFHPWHTVRKMSVRDLPAGVVLQVAIAPAAFSMEQDVRNYHQSEMRAVPLPRIWEINGDHLEDKGYFDRWQKYEIGQIYRCVPELNCFAIEPNTNGMFSAAGSVLYYSNRSEPMPERMAEAVVIREPLWNLLASHDGGDLSLRKVALEPVENARSSGSFRFRFLMEVPSGQKYILTQSGGLRTYTDNAGWSTGKPKPMSIATQEFGTYKFTLQSTNEAGELFEDVALHQYLKFEPDFKADLREMVSSIQAIVFDQYQRMWIWTGEEMVPVRIMYDCFLFDRESRSIYLTRKYEQIEVR